jgi:hypothetical protein
MDGLLYSFIHVYQTFPFIPNMPLILSSSYEQVIQSLIIFVPRLDKFIYSFPTISNPK